MHGLLVNAFNITSRMPQRSMVAYFVAKEIKTSCCGRHVLA